MLVAIHQPNFFPWLGYFDKIKRADIFIFLDAVDYPRSGSGGMGSWVNRVKLSIQGEARWVTCPVKRMPLGSPVLAAQISDGQPWRVKLLKTLKANYSKAANYDETMELLNPLIGLPETNLACFNIAAIKTIAARLGISTNFLRQSELAQEGQATELLISLIKAVGGDTYLAGGGAGDYQEDDLFSTHGIGLVYQNFRAQPYGRADRFITGLSVIDYLMHDGRKLSETTDDDLA